MAYGHPLLHMGRTDPFATNAWIDGIWGINYEPSTYGCRAPPPGAVRHRRGGTPDGVDQADGKVVFEVPVPVVIPANAVLDAGLSVTCGYDADGNAIQARRPRTSW